MSVKKAMYLIIEAFHPDCKRNLMKDMDEAHFALEYDEATNSEGEKELHIQVRFWSSLRDQVVEPPSGDVFHGTCNW